MNFKKIFLAILVSFIGLYAISLIIDSKFNKLENNISDRFQILEENLSKKNIDEKIDVENFSESVSEIEKDIILDKTGDGKFFDNISIKEDALKEEIEIKEDAIKEVEKVKDSILINGGSLNTISLDEKKPLILNNAFNQYLEIQGFSIQKIKIIGLKCGDTLSFIKASRKGDLTVSGIIKAGSLRLGFCQIGYMRNGIFNPSNFKFFISNKKIEEGVLVQDITPRFISDIQGGVVVFQGVKLKDVIAIQFNDKVILDTDFIDFISNKVIAVYLPKNMGIGEHKFTLLTKNGFISDTDFVITVK